jgi:hypothetical protein
MGFKCFLKQLDWCSHILIPIGQCQFDSKKTHDLRNILMSMYLIHQNYLLHVFNLYLGCLCVDGFNLKKLNSMTPVLV